LQPSIAPSSANAGSPANDLGRESSAPCWIWDVLSLLLLAAMVSYFLKISWRKWPDPIVDSGPQLYALWQVSEGAQPYHDFLWNYGPFSLCLNAALFKMFGPGLMVLVAANLVFYALIFAMGYWACRMAWGRLGAFAAMAVFVSVFSFSHLLGVGNYNFVTPYAAEASHGIALMLATVLILGKWCRNKSWKLAFLLGLCGGLATVMKPEFMLAGAVLGMAAIVLRWRHGLRLSLAEILCIAFGIVLPTLGFTLWFARGEPFTQAFIDASQAWWLVLVAHMGEGNIQQVHFIGFDHPSANIWKEVIWCTGAIGVMAVLWLMGRVVNRARVASNYIWDAIVLLVLFGAVVVECVRNPEWFAAVNKGWISVGWCLPGLIAIIFVMVVIRITRGWWASPQMTERNVMALLLVLLAGTMLARMFLFPRIYHFGFFQAALAAMVVSAAMVSELPRWTGEGAVGRFVTAAVCLLVLGWCCGAIAAKSNAIRADQTEAVGQGPDRFYTTTRMIDGTGALVNWAAVRMSSTPTNAEVLVLPEGAMINYLSRRKSPNSTMLRESEEKFVEQLRRNPPEYVVLISREVKEFGLTRYGARGNPGEYLVPWVGENYKSVEWVGGDPLDPDAQVGGVILRLKKDLPAGR
jgi:hypothetical protein